MVVAPGLQYANRAPYLWGKIPPQAIFRITEASTRSQSLRGQLPKVPLGLVFKETRESQCLPSEIRNVE